MRTEAIEELADRIFLYQPGDISKGIAKKKAVELAKLQQEKSIDDMQYYMEYCLKNPYITPEEWILNYKHY